LIFSVSFNDRGDVTRTEQLGIDTTYKVSMVDEKTPTRGKELGFFEQIFSNIGRFSSEGPVQPGY
jgi:hypothetical protein